MLQIETQGASELASFRHKPTSGSLSTRQLRRNEARRGGWETNAGEGRVESKLRGETANLAKAQNDATENSLEVPASHR